MREFYIATGQSCRAKRWSNELWSWERLTERLSEPAIMRFTAAEFAALSRVSQTDAKDVGGYVGGYLDDGSRKTGSVRYRTLVCLDYDVFSEERLADIRRLPFAWALHTTAKSTAAKWRVRLVIPTDRNVSVDEYGALSRLVAGEIGSRGLDRSTFEAARLMFWPARTRDGHWHFETSGSREPLRVDEWLARYEDWRNVSEWPRVEGEPIEGLYTGNGAKSGDGRQEDPTQKPGLIGAFCRTYDIPAVIDRYLGDVYRSEGRGRYTHLGSTTTGGGVVHDEGRFFYSHHSTDPAAMRLLNSWDLVRIHRFGGLDEAGSDIKSRKAMEELAMEDPDVRRRLGEERKARAIADFGDIIPEPTAPEQDGHPRSREDEEGDERWERVLASLECDKKGNYRTTINSVATVIMHHPDLRGKIRYNEFTGDIDVTGKLPWRRVDSETWLNSDYTMLQSWLEREFGMEGEPKIARGVETASQEQSYHPVKDYFNSLEWDGEERLSKLLTEILGAEDTPLHRELPRLIFTACVRRVFRPGEKFDYFVILSGEQGTFKSTLFRIMGGKWFSDSITTIMGKEAMEQVQGVMLSEMAELVSTKKSENEVMKSFISREKDKFRPAYGRKNETRSRVCVFVGTTNENDFLSGEATGNRRSPVALIEKRYRRPGLDVRGWLIENRDQCWAEAVKLHREGYKIYLSDELEEAAKETQNRFNRDRNTPEWGQIERFLDLWLPENWDGSYTLEDRRNWLRSNPGTISGLGFKRRETVTVPEILMESYGMERKDQGYAAKGRKVGQVLRGMDGWKEVGIRATPLYGKQKTWRRTGGIESEDPESLDNL